MKYSFNLKMQAMWGITSFISAFAVLYLFTKEFNWTISFIIAIVNFIISGYYTKYTRYKCR